jgi:hypothetical protein
VFVLRFRWEKHGGLVGRAGVGLAVVLATTFGGPASPRVSAGVRTRAERVHRADPAETVFAFGDDLDAVNYELAFEPDARDGQRLAAACQAVLADQSGFQAVLRAAKAQDVAADLAADSEPTIEVCFSPQAADEDAQARAAEGFAEFHERAFDFAAGVQ